MEQAVSAFLKRNHLSQITLKAVLFDMDGVLFDSMKNHTRAWYRVITELGIACTLEEFYLYEGRTGASTINLLFDRAYGRKATPDEIKRIYDTKTRYFNELSPAEPMEGALVLLNRLTELDITPVLVTGSGQVSLLNKLNHSFPQKFSREHMVTAHDVKHGKPDPEPYLMGLQRVGVSAGQAIVVENAPMGVEAAHAAGIFTVAVNTGPMDDAVLWDAGADLVLPGMSELNACFETLYETLNRTKV